MELSIENKVTKTKDNTQIDKFTKELSKSLNNKLEIKTEPTVYEELIATNELARKFKSKLPSLIRKCILENSNWDEFYYLEYNKKDKKYYMVYCDEGLEKYEMKPEDIAKNGYVVGKFYEDYPADDNYILESDAKYTIINDVERELKYLEKDLKNEHK